jgi:hypothetical protein
MIGPAHPPLGGGLVFSLYDAHYGFKEIIRNVGFVKECPGETKLGFASFV